MALLWTVRSLKQCIPHQRFSYSPRYSARNQNLSHDPLRQIVSDVKLRQMSYSKEGSSKLVIDERQKWEKSENKRREVAAVKAQGTMAQMGFMTRALANMAFLCFSIIFACIVTSAMDHGFRRRLRKSYPWFASWTDLVLEKEVEEEEMVLDDGLKQKAAAEHRKFMIEQLKEKRRSRRRRWCLMMV